MTATPVTKPAPARPEPHPHLQPLTPRARRLLYAGAVLLLVWLGFGGWGVWKTFGESRSPAPSVAQLKAQQKRVAELEQQVATLNRSDQISRQANTDLQSTLAERDEEIAALRADVAFYERFVGATAQRRGLTVHKLQLQPQNDQSWHFIATLTQNLNRGAVNAGRLQVAVEGTRGGKLQKLAWTELRQAGDPGVAYSFKYFQEVEGDMVLPLGFRPARVAVRLVPQHGGPVEQSFAWSEAVADGA
ncbi:membrane protein [Pseudoxanthomonas sangjuensis]